MLWLHAAQPQHIAPSSLLNIPFSVETPVLKHTIQARKWFVVGDSSPLLYGINEI
jgi:hypothetical protein